MGLLTVDAVRNDELYVITHPEFRSLLLYRQEQLIEACDRGEARQSGGNARLGGEALIAQVTGGASVQP